MNRAGFKPRNDIDFRDHLDLVSLSLRAMTSDSEAGIDDYSERAWPISIKVTPTKSSKNARGTLSIKSTSLKRN